MQSVTMNEAGYTVHTERFHGPLDLLLQLIVRSELEVTEISLADVADKYLAHVRDLSDVDVDDAGEFLVIAATLVEIKSRLLSPDDRCEGADRKKKGPAGPMDAAALLVEQLLAFKAYREAGEILERRRDDWLRRYPSGRAAVDREALAEATRPDDDTDLEDLGLYDLVEAFRRIAETVQFERLGEHAVEDDDTPIELHQADIVDTLERHAREQRATPTLRTVFAGRTRLQVCGMFIGLLELVRQRRLKVTPVEGGHDVELALREPEEDAVTLE
ncbi:MAG: segregation/condensation protein A [Planctomycetota bacterium]